MQRACFLHQLCSPGSSVTEALYLLAGCVPGSMSRGRSQDRCSQQGWSRAARGAGISPAAQPRRFLSDSGPQLKEIPCPGCSGSSVQTPRPTGGQIFGGCGCHVQQLQPGRAVPGMAAMSSVQGCRTPGRAGHGPSPPHSDSGTPNGRMCAGTAGAGTAGAALPQPRCEGQGCRRAGI